MGGYISFSVGSKDASLENKPKNGSGGNQQQKLLLHKITKNEKGFIIPEKLPVSDTPEDYIPVIDLYNLITLGCPHPFLVSPKYSLIIDCRDLSSYQKRHILSSKHCSMVSENLISLVCRNSRLQFAHIILYGSKKHKSRAEELLSRIDKDGLKARILLGGFERFYDIAPFLCTEKLPQEVPERRDMIASYPSMILEGVLYLGTCLHAKSREVVSHLGITHIVNITVDVPCTFEQECRYLHLKYEDEQQVQIFPIFHEAADFIAKGIHQNGVVFVHCVAGVSRSSALIIAFMMKHLGLSLRDAYSFVKRRREIVSPNRGFLKQLMKFEDMLFGERLSDLADPVFH